MTMVSSGPISLGGNATTGGLNQSINIELGQSATATISLNDANVRTLLGVPSGAISLNNAYGKANQFAFTISTNQTNANLRSLAVAAGWNQTSRVSATIAGGVTLSSNNTGIAALTVSGSFPGGVAVINNGSIIGMGGNGGNGGGAGANGGAAFLTSVAVTVTNNGAFYGGGGGGGGGSAAFNGCDSYGCSHTTGGSGGGGGRSSLAANSAGGSGVTAGGQSSNCRGNNGNAGTSSGAGSGGAMVYCVVYGGAGGNGGDYGAAGSRGGFVDSPYGGGPYSGFGPGGSGGEAVIGNSNITWLAFGTRLGAIT